MIKGRSRKAISNANCFSRFRRLGDCFMAAASNSMLGQRDFNMSFTRLSSNLAATSSVVDLRRGGIFAYGLRLKGCSSENYGNVLRNSNDFKSDRVGGNEVLKARAYVYTLSLSLITSWTWTVAFASFGPSSQVIRHRFQDRGPSVPQLLRVSEEVLTAEDRRRSLDSRAVNGGGASANRGYSAGALDQPSQEKVMVAVDVDEVLGNFVSALNKFIADRYSLNHSVSEYHVYEFFKIWKCSRDEADHRVHEFFKTAYFKKGINPIPGAREALEKLSEIYNLSIVTSRQNVIKDHTVEWIEKHYPGLFREIHFGNHFALDGQSRPKSDICKSLGAKVLIDDNPRYAMECAAVGIRVLLFDYENSYPWCKVEHSHQHPLVTKVHNWEEVEQQLSSLVVS